MENEIDVFLTEQSVEVTERQHPDASGSLIVTERTTVTRDIYKPKQEAK